MTNVSGVLQRENVPGQSRAMMLAVGLALVHLLLAWISRTPGLGWGEDDAAFLLLAQDLQQFGYREIQDVLAPVHARFPPVFPAMLAIVGKLTGNNLEVLLAFVGICSAAGILLLFDATRRVVGDNVALLASGLYAINPTALADAGTLMSEAPFKLFIILALWGAIRENEGARYAVVAGAGVILGALTRSAGVALIPALAVYWLAKRRYMWVVALAIASIPVAAWIGWTFSAPDASDRRLYVADITGATAEVPFTLRTRLARIFPAISLYLTNLIPWTVAYPTVAGTPVDNIMWLGVTLVLGAAGVFALFRKWMLLLLFLASYGALLVVWRFAFVRLVNPVVPLLLVVLVVGAYVLSEKLVPRYTTPVVTVLALLLALGAGRRVVPDLQSRLACDRSDPAASRPCWPVYDRELLTLAHWVRDSTPPDAVFLVPKERAFFVHSGRMSINQDRAFREDSASIGDYLRAQGVDYTVLSPIGVFPAPQARLVTRACRELALVRQFSPQTMLFRVLPQAASSDSASACETLRGYTMAQGGEQP